MARPNNTAAIQGYVQGLREAKAQFQALPVVMQEEQLVATEDTLKAIVAAAQRHLLSSPSIRTRNLFNAVAYSLNKKSGRGKAGIANVTSRVSASAGSVGRLTVKVRGIVIAGKGGGAQGGRLDVPRRRAHLTEFGTRFAPAEPFMTPAAREQTAPALARFQAAGRRAETRLAYGSAPGGGTSSTSGLL